MEINLKKIKKAQKVLKGVIKSTKLFHSMIFSEITGNEIYFKPENLQKTGAFKIRGAYNKIAGLKDIKQTKVIASSAGNHAQGVAYAATEYGIDSIIVMPENTPIAKVTATRDYGAEVILHGKNYDQAYAKAREIQKQNDYIFVHPFDDPEIIAGQGTIGLEIMNELSSIDYILVPIGGGGLISGIATAVKNINPEIKIIGVEESNNSAMKNCLESGKLQSISCMDNIAEGITVKKPGSLTFEICQKYVDDIVVVNEEEIANAILMLLEKSKIVVEGAGATPLAAVLNNKLGVKNKTIVPVLSGGNIDVNLVSRIIERGLTKAGRRINFETTIMDRPGNLHELLSVIADLDANIISIEHDHSYPGTSIQKALVSLELEVRDKEHGEKVYSILQEKGYKIDKK